MIMGEDRGEINNPGAMPGPGRPLLRRVKVGRSVKALNRFYIRQHIQDFGSSTNSNTQPVFYIIYINKLWLLSQCTQDYFRAPLKIRINIVIPKYRYSTGY